MKFFILLFSLISKSTFGLETFCFSRATSLKAVKAHIKILASSKDQIYINERKHCVELVTSSSKNELFNKWIRKKFKVVSSSEKDQIQVMANSRNCRLQVERQMAEESNEKEFSVGQRTALKESETSVSGKSVSSLLLRVGTVGHIKVNDQRVSLGCQSVSGNSYRVRISLESDSMGLGTEVIVMAGAKTNLGSVVENLNRKRTSKGVPSGVSMKKNSGQINFDYYLMAKP